MEIEVVRKVLNIPQGEEVWSNKGFRDKIRNSLTYLSTILDAWMKM